MVHIPSKEKNVKKAKPRFSPVSVHFLVWVGVRVSARGWAGSTAVP